MNMTENICYNCFRENPAGQVCPHCGYDPSKAWQDYPLALPHGTVPDGRYILGRVLGQGGFGITYVAQEWNSKQLMAVKEYLPDSLGISVLAEVEDAILKGLSVQAADR